MTISIKIDDTVRFPVKGKLFDKEGREREFLFELDLYRMDQDEFDRALADSGISTRALVERHARGWHGVQDAEGKDVPFGAEAFSRLLRIPGLSNLIWVAYCSHAGAREKNSERSSA